MGKKTSVYLSDDLLKRWRASKLPHSEVFRRGLDAIERPEPDLEETLTRVIRRELPGLTDRPSSYSAAADGYSSEPYEEIP